MFDELNACVIVRSDGILERYDADRVAAILAKLGSVEVAVDIQRCLDLGDFSSNRLLALSSYQGASGALQFMYVTPYIKDETLKARALFGAFTYDEITLPVGLRTAYPTSYSRGVSLRQCTRLFDENPRLIALFNDNILGQIPDDYDFGFFFADKFVARYYDETLMAIDGLWAPAAFSVLRQASHSQLALAVSIWVYLHEYFHRESALPIATFTQIKNSFLAGAFEELRVDLSVIVEDISDAVGPAMRELVFEYVLAERLIYYATVFEPKDDYDAVNSVVLGRHLIGHDILTSDVVGRYQFDADAKGVRNVLRQMLNRMDRIDQRLSLQADAMVDDLQLQKTMRGYLEDTMSLMCGACDRKSMRRDALHDAHAAQRQARLISGSVQKRLLERVV